MEVRDIKIIKGTYKGYEYIAFEGVTEVVHMLNGYVKLPDSHPLYRAVNKTKTWDFAKRAHEHKDYDAADTIDVHGGFTFGEQITQEDIDRGRWIQGFTPGLWLGWDYAHSGDCFFDHTNPKVAELGLGLCDKGFPEKHWKIEEVQKECKHVIKQLVTRERVTIDK